MKRFYCLLSAAMLTLPALPAAAETVYVPYPRTQVRIEVPAVPLPAGTRTVRDIVYKTADGRDLKLDLYLPAKSHAGKPLLVWIHGGAWRRGSKEDFPVRNSRLASELLKNGYALASVEYRLSGAAKFPAQIQDVNDALHFLAAHGQQYGWNADNIMLGGRSAGAHLAALAALPARVPEGFATRERPQTLNIKAAAVFFGIYDLIALGVQKNNPQGGSETALLGAPPADLPDMARAASPLSYAGRHSPPVIIMHGIADRTVPHAQSEMLHSALQQAGATAELHLVKDAKHGDAAFDNEENVAKTLAFLNRYR